MKSWVFLLQGATLSSISTVVPGSGENQPRAQPPVGRQAGGCCSASPAPSHLPCIPPASLEESCCWALLASFLSLVVEEERFFPQQVLTGLAQICPREIWQKCPPASYDWETGSTSLSPLKHQPPELLLTPSVSSRQKTGTVEASLHPDALTCQCISASGLKPEGTDLALLSLSYFNRQARTCPNTQSRN